MLIRISLLALAALILAAVPAIAAEPSGDPAASMYGPETVAAIDLTLPQASIEALEADPTGAYQDGIFSLASTDGTPGGIGAFSAPIKVGIRLKGKAGSFKPLGEKAAFKVKFSHVSGQRFLGLKGITLNNMVQDPSMVHETLAYTAFRALGVDASRTGYAFVRLNGEPLGVYLNVENLDDIGLEKRFGPFDDPQHLYEGEYGTDARAADVEDFEVDEGDDADLSDLEALAAAVAGGVPADWSDRVDPHADLAQMTRMWAVEKYAGHWDGYAGKADESEHDLPNNFYLFSNPFGQFQMLPWGADQTWEERVSFGGGGGLLFDGCQADASCALRFQQALGEALETMPTLALERTARCAAERLKPWQALEDPEIRPYEPAEIAAAVASTRTFATGRPGELAGWLGSPLVTSTHPGCAWEVLDQAGTEPSPIPAGPASAAPNSDPLSERPVAPSLRFAGVARKPSALIARFHVSAPGDLDLRATLRTRDGNRTACTATASPTAAGSISLRCELTQAARDRLAIRWLRLHLKAQLASPPAPAAHLTTSITLPRTASPNR